MDKPSTQRKPQPPFVKHYLAFYNLVQFCGWGFGLILALKFMLFSKPYSHRLLWEHCSMIISIFQTLQLMEVVHAAIKFVPSNPIQTFIQIFSRLMLVWGILVPIVDARDSIGVPMLLIAWSIAECTRYIYYALNIYDAVPYLSTWLRYSLFIVLYPLGVSGELLTTYAALAPIRRMKFLSLELPNALNISFYYDIYCILFMLSYVHFFPQLYLYMMHQRKKILSNSQSKRD
ncbi:Very-long-chain (3R)-3-hydroxyacyl-CoA dehydratase 2 [Sarcoptes scabiei]|uniref:Very-long-chain (3R)-3-hydroxyacyl-CoA dehydratase n=1 Tax=Sarcoptes scabiei TaxID=52283 RepID=A0A834VG19_SARSC|nr:Very-long-chain (3R)-3-hydroxyacyl-CoA dehydratase 2 [Sarcoptes scabiei]UXI21876.1 peptidoglycan-recognition protein SC2-like [Sarcoptes scabiei]